jgi:hypothetical protein
VIIFFRDSDMVKHINMFDFLIRGIIFIFLLTATRSLITKHESIALIMTYPVTEYNLGGMCFSKVEFQKLKASRLPVVHEKISSGLFPSPRTLSLICVQVKK